MNQHIRAAVEADIAAMARLSEQKRTEYEQYAPTFWRKAAEGTPRQMEFFAHLLQQPETIALVSEVEGDIRGFLIARVLEAPPVYDPGSRVAWIDDFCVADVADWETVGKNLLQSAREQAEEGGARLAVVICAHLDQPKREMLRGMGFSIAAETWVNAGQRR